MQSLEEHDVDSLLRKFSLTYTMFDNGVIEWVSNICKDKLLWRSGKIINGKPLYHHFKSGFYSVKNKTYLLLRKNVKTFKVGVCSENYTCSIYDLTRNQWLETNLGNILNFDKNLTIDVERALKVNGPISKTMYVSDCEIYYYDKSIGFRKNHTFLLSDKSLIQEVKDALKEATFEGKKCEVTCL